MSPETEYFFIQLFVHMKIRPIHTKSEFRAQKKKKTDLFLCGYFYIVMSFSSIRLVVNETWGFLHWYLSFYDKRPSIYEAGAYLPLEGFDVRRSWLKHLVDLPNELSQPAGCCPLLTFFLSCDISQFRAGVTWMLKVNIQTDQTDSPYHEEITLAVNLTVPYCVAMFGRLFAKL